MEFKVNRKELSDTLTAAQSCVEPKGAIPALSFVLLESKGGKAELTATDLDVTLKTAINAEGGNCAFAVPAKQLASLVSLFDGDEVSFATKDKIGRVQVASGKAKYQLPELARDSFPVIEKVEGKEFFIKGSMLKTMLERTVFAVSTEESRYALQGVYLETKNGKLYAVATDGFRLALMKYPIPFSETVSGIVPRRAVNAILKAVNDDEPVAVRFSETHIQISQFPLTVSARLVIGKYPNYEMIIPKDRDHSFALSTEAVRVFKRAALTARIGGANNSPEIFFDVSKEGIEVSSAEADKGEGADFLPVECKTLNGSTVKLGIASKQVLDMLAHEPEINWGFDSNESAFLLTPSGLREYEYIYVTMPVRVP